MVADLPDLKLSYQRDRRLFSRTLQLVVEASMSGPGPSDDATLAMRTQKLRRRWELEWSGPDAEGRESVPDRFTRAGLVEGARAMTNVRELVVSWSRARQTWRLRLVTLAGALIGTAPGTGITVPMEPEDVAGLLQILRAFKAAVTEGGPGS